MKNILKFSFIFLLILSACQKDAKEQKTSKAIHKTETITKYASFGAKINKDQALSAKEMFAKFKTMNVGDTIDVKFASHIKEVCSKKGCWMKLPLANEQETMVRFKDYGFFMPLDAANKEVIVAGKAFVKITPIEELQHYAEDAGKSATEIAKITAPKKEFAFEANGVLLASK